MAQTIYFAGSADAYIGTITSDGVDPCAHDGLAAFVATRTNSWANRIGDYGLQATLDANNETGMCSIYTNTFASYTTETVSGDAWVNACYEASDVTPAARYKIGRIGSGSGSWFNNYTLEVEPTSGDLRFYNASAVAVGSAYSPGFVADTLYWFLFHFDSSTNDQIDVYIGEADPNDPRRLKNAADWDTAKMTLTDATQTGTFGQLHWGPRSYKTTNPTLTGRWEPPVHFSEKPTQPIVTEYLEVNADGYYSATGAGGTNWDNEDASVASYDRVDDANTGAPDEDTTYIVIPNLASGKVSFGVESPSTIKASDTIHTVIMVGRVRRAGGSLGNMGLMIRQNSTDSAAPTAVELNGSASYLPCNKQFDTAPDGSAWTYDKLADLEVGVNTDATQGLWRFTAMGAIVVYQPAKSLPYQRRSSMRAALVR